MIEEPYRWVEAIQNRREYIDHQLAAGSAIIALSCREGVLILTLGRDRQKLFEIYDRIAMGGIGHPGDIERLRMMALEVTSTEGFTRSPQDVSLRRLVSYSLSPALKTAFEQVYGPPYLVRLLFAEVGRGGEADLLVALNHDGSFETNGGTFSREVEPFAVISGSAAVTRQMEAYLRERSPSASAELDAARELALETWLAGNLALGEESPTPENIRQRREEVLRHSTVEAALLERNPRVAAAAYRVLPG